MSMKHVDVLVIGGGMIPTFITIRDYGLMNTPYTLIILGGISIYNMIVTRTYFSTNIPDTFKKPASICTTSFFCFAK